MAEIKILSQAVADKIAAGEVAERPAAVVKELVENSIDAGASRITVEIKKGGIAYISVEDNGKGIPYDEVEFAFVRHATSKLREIEDLSEIQTMGFRGEALASICAVSDVEVITKEKGADEGAHVSVSHGVVSQKEMVACNEGTLFVVKNLFASVPARMKFLKKDATEAGYITDVLGRIALSKPEIAFRYICDGEEVFSTSGDGQLKNAILNIYGIEHAKGVLDVCHEELGVNVTGVVGKAELARGNRARQTLFVNGRYIKNHVVSKIVEEAYRNVIMRGKFPFFVLNIEISPSLVDVNVHPAKTEIKFANEKAVYDIVYHAVKNAIYKKTEMPVVEKNVQPGVPERVQSDKERQLDAVDKQIVMDFMKNTVPSQGMSFKSPTAQEKDEKITVKFEDLFGKETTTVKPQDIPEETEPAVVENVIEEDVTRLIGQVFDTYLIAQKGEKLFLIDQHAAHERKRFEILKKDYESRGVSGQILLSPIVFDADSREMQTVEENRQALSDMGFEIESFGKNSLIIRQTPFISDEDEIKSLALEVIGILNEARPSGLLSFEERILDTISCKYAIKANKKLSSVEMEVLIRDVEDLEKQGITTCPHGRPIKIEFSKREVEKMFKRIV